MIISRTPLRVSLFGGGTDFKEYYEEHEGRVVSTTIDKFVYILVNPNYLNDDIVLNYFEKERVSSPEEVKHNIFREVLKFVNITKGVEITSLTDIPLQGTGLGSSSAFTVGLLNALFAYKGQLLDPFELAEMASYIEINVLGEPIGKQDQYAAAFGGLREYIFCKDGSVKVEEVKLEAQGYETISSHMLLFHTGIERKASSVLTDQKNRIHQNSEHLHELKEIVHKSRNHLLKLEINKIGDLLNLNWEKKKKLSTKIQNEQIDDIYNLGMQEGAYGGKLLGAGGGGFFCFFCPLSCQPALRNRLKNFKELPFSIALKGSECFLLKDMGNYGAQTHEEKATTFQTHN